MRITAKGQTKGWAINCDTFYQTKHGDFKKFWSENLERAYLYSSRDEAQKELDKAVKKLGVVPEHFAVVEVWDTKQKSKALAPDSAGQKWLEKHGGY